MSDNLSLSGEGIKGRWEAGRCGKDSSRKLSITVHNTPNLPYTRVSRESRDENWQEDSLSLDTKVGVLQLLLYLDLYLHQDSQQYCEDTVSMPDDC